MPMTKNHAAHNTVKTRLGSYDLTILLNVISVLIKLKLGTSQHEF
jgi:hypothetical protein